MQIPQCSSCSYEMQPDKHVAVSAVLCTDLQRRQAFEQHEKTASSATFCAASGHRSSHQNVFRKMEDPGLVPLLSFLSAMRAAKAAHRYTASNHEQMVVALSQNALPTHGSIHPHWNVLCLYDLLDDSLQTQSRHEDLRQLLWGSV